MIGTALHSRLLAQALVRVLGPPQPGALAYVRCLTPDVVEQLAPDASFDPVGWAVWRVADVEQADLRTLTADRAVELREGKGDAIVLLVDTARAGAGMDGIYSAAREVDEADLFRVAMRLAAAEITERWSREIHNYAEDAIRVAGQEAGGRHAVSPWTAFDFLCRVAVGEGTPGANLNILGLWPVRDVEGTDHKQALSDSRRFVDRLLGPAVTSLAPVARIELLRLDEESKQRQAQLACFLHAADTRQLQTALNELAEQPELWIGSLNTEGPSQFIKNIELLPWRNRSGNLHRWSGLTFYDSPEGPPVLFLGTDEDERGTTLEVRWKADPGDLERGAVDYRVEIQTPNLKEELAFQNVSHSARKGGEKCRFNRDDFASLSDDSEQPAKVVIAVIGDQNQVGRQDSEEFVIRFGEPQIPESSGVGGVERTFSEGLTDMRSRDAVTGIASNPSLAAGSGSSGYVTLRTPVEHGRRRNFRVSRPSLIAEVEGDWWPQCMGRIGRWEVKVRGSGERAGSARFKPLTGAGPEWERADTATRRVAERFANTCGGVAQIYDERSKSFELIREYLRAWAALLKTGDPAYALVNTVEVQSLSGRPIGLIVLPAHPLRVAWHAAYDNLVLHAAFEQRAPASAIRRELKGLDGAMFPDLLPNPHGGAFVFADSLGFHAVGMVWDRDPEPKAAVALLARALGDNSATVAPTVGGQSSGVLGSEIIKYMECHDTARLLRVHALRAGDGMTVARALGEVHRHFRPMDEDAEDAKLRLANAAFSLDLYPSEAQRGVTGRFIADAREKRRSGAGVLAEGDRWMLESLSLPGGVTLPRLRWARKDQQDPRTAAHVAIAFDTFESRVIAAPADSAPKPRPYHAFGLTSFYERVYTSLPAPRWTSTASPASRGEKHPSGRHHTETLSRLQEELHRAVARALGVESGAPVLQTIISRRKADSLDALHRLCDWVVTLDRNAGIEYFDSPRDQQVIYDAYVIDCVPEREDLGCLQLITSTANLREVRSLLDRALDQMGLSP